MGSNKYYEMKCVVMVGDGVWFVRRMFKDDFFSLCGGLRWS